METFLDTYVMDGGPLMVALIACSIILIAAIIQLSFRMSRARVLPQNLIDEAAGVSTPAERAQYVAGIRGQTSALARALYHALKELDLRGGQVPTRAQIDPIVHEAAAHVSDDLYDELGKLTTIYTIAPLLGLLGTILGMMKAFHEFGSSAQAKDLTLLSEGIQQALVTTMWGLGIAILAYISAQVFQTRIRRYERRDLLESVTEILAALLTGGAAKRAEARKAQGVAASQIAPAPEAAEAAPAAAEAAPPSAPAAPAQATPPAEAESP